MLSFSRTAAYYLTSQNYPSANHPDVELIDIWNMPPLACCNKYPRSLQLSMVKPELIFLTQLLKPSGAFVIQPSVRCHFKMWEDDLPLFINFQFDCGIWNSLMSQSSFQETSTSLFWMIPQYQTLLQEVFP